MLLLSPHRLRLGALILIVALLGGMLPAAAQGPIADAQIVTEYLNLRAQPSDSAAVVQRLPYGTQISLQGRTEDAAWLYGTTTGGATGWIKASWVAIRTDLDVLTCPSPTGRRRSRCRREKPPHRDLRRGRLPRATAAVATVHTPSTSAAAPARAISVSAPWRWAPRSACAAGAGMAAAPGSTAPAIPG
jgi:hypothetical protein